MVVVVPLGYMHSALHVELVGPRVHETTLIILLSTFFEDSKDCTIAADISSVLIAAYMCYTIIILSLSFLIIHSEIALSTCSIMTVLPLFLSFYYMYTSGLSDRCHASDIGSQLLCIL